MATKDPQRTRRRLLKSAYEEIYRHGFQATSLNTVLKRANMTKGALYHHFPNKNALGHAVIEEMLRETFEEGFLQYLHQKDNFIDGFIHALDQGIKERGQELLNLGCPLNNLAQEMSPLDETFRTRIEATFSWVLDQFANGIRHDQQQGKIKADEDPNQIALFLLAAMEGCLGLAKNSQSLTMFRSCTQTLAHFVQTLKA
ncbi:TetR/AcrR family transcriptional regulator [Magnetococcales bacterium HHB-1]